MNYEGGMPENLTLTAIKETLSQERGTGLNLCAGAKGREKILFLLP